MSISIVPYTAGREPAIEAFNQRLRRGRVSYVFPRSADVTETASDAPIQRRGFVAVEPDGTVRGGYFVKEQDGWLHGRRARVGFIQLPLSEGVVDRRFGTLGVRLIAHAQKQRPLLFALGMGGAQESIAKVLVALGWPMAPVPFFFKICRPRRVALGLRALRRTAAQRVVWNGLGWTGLAALGAAAMQWRPNGGPRAQGVKVERVDDLDGVADEVWERSREDWRFAAWRDRHAVRARAAAVPRRYGYWVLRQSGRPVAWAITLITNMHDDHYFGDLRLGSVVDGFGEAAGLHSLVGGISDELASDGVDAIVSNQSSARWVAALRGAGFLQRSSNFLLALSPALDAAIGPLAATRGDLHFTRGDGDGPIHL